MTKITSQSILAKIGKIETNFQNIRNDVHDVACDILTFIAPEAAGGQGEGDTTTALTLVQKLPASWAPQVVAWFKEFSPVKILAGSGKHSLLETYKKLPGDQKAAHWKLSDARAKPFWELTKEGKAADTYDFGKLLEASTTGRAKALLRKIENGEVKAEDIESVRALATALSGLKVARVVIKEAPKPEEPANEDAGEGAMTKPEEAPKTGTNG